MTQVPFLDSDGSYVSIVVICCELNGFVKLLDCLVMATLLEKQPRAGDVTLGGLGGFGTKHV
jgi:hypothetical protein